MADGARAEGATVACAAAGSAEVEEQGSGLAAACAWTGALLSSLLSGMGAWEAARGAWADAGCTGIAIGLPLSSSCMKLECPCWRCPGRCQLDKAAESSKLSGGELGRSTLNC